MIHPEDPSQKQIRLEMIRQALRGTAPLTYEVLDSSGKLQEFLEAHDAEMMASYDEAKKMAWERTMDRFLSFSDGSYDETSSPM